ncbi:MAG: 16S rRNA (cytosine967-C5)-methyltransferase, partial [Enterobacterales bacterium]
MSAALRARVAKGVSQVISQGKSLSEVLPDYAHLEPKDKSLARELTIGTLRQYFQLKAIVAELIEKPLKKKDDDILCLILVGLYQLFHT